MLTKLCVVTIIAFFNTPNGVGEYGVSVSSNYVPVAGAKITCEAVMNADVISARQDGGASFVRSSWALSEGTPALRGVDVFLGYEE